MLTYSVMRLGYGSISPDDDKPSFLAKLLNDHKGWRTRALWGLIVAGIGSLPLFYMGRLSVLGYMGYLLLNSGINAVLGYFNAEVNLHELLAGVLLGSIVLLV